MATYNNSPVDEPGAGGYVDPTAIVPGMAAGPGAGTGTDPAAPPAKPSHRRRKLILLLGVVVPLILVLVMLSTWELKTRKPLSTLPGIGQNTPHYAFSIYGVAQPIGVAVSRSGDRIYVTETEGTRSVKMYDRSGKAVGTLTPPKSTGGSHIPVYVAVNPVNGGVYVSDRLTGEVYVYDQSGRYSKTFEPKGDIGAGWAPMGLAFDKKGRLYATDVRADPHRILVFGTDGTLEKVIGADDKLSFPNCLVVDDKGNIAVTDSNNGRLIVYSPSGKQLAVITRGVGDGDLGLPRGTAVDADGRLYVVDTSNHAVRIYKVGTAKAPMPRYLDSFGDEGTLDGLFEYPNGIAADTRARVYITDRENNRVQVWTY